MSSTKYDRLDWEPTPVRRLGRTLVLEGVHQAVQIEPPRLYLSSPEDHRHIAGWRVLPGGAFDEASEAEDGVVRRYFAVDHDDSDWYEAARVNEIPFGFPTWEGSAFSGYLWYRAVVATPPSTENLELLLGSVLDLRKLRWRVWLNGVESSPPNWVEGGLVSVPLRHPLPDEQLVIAVQLHVTRDWPTDELRERESWKVLDLYCHQMIAPVSARTPLSVLEAVATGSSAIVHYEQDVTMYLDFAHADSVLRASATVEGPRTAWVSQVEFPVPSNGAKDRRRHDEGAWVKQGDSFQAIAHPAGVTILREDETTSVMWPGRSARGLKLPDLLLGLTGAASAGGVRSFLERIGRAREPRRIYDPYGRYQISHTGEPKTEFDESLLNEVDVTLRSLAGQGVKFDAFAIDCGWNDPDDLSRLNTANFPNGTAPLSAFLERHNLDLLLWVSPSDGPRAFRHELGLVNPGYTESLSRNPVLPWRLCPSAEPWRHTFQEALLSLVKELGAKGFKIDGTDLWCAATTHGHSPGIFSLFANTVALSHTLEAVIDAGAPFLMTYWGLRSPWWLRWAVTLWERDYLVEAAGPSGSLTWSLRLGIASSQDIGQQRSWTDIAPHQQDSLGVWVSDTIWASHQGKQDWADAFALDLARGSLLTQLWGDLRMLDNPSDVAKLKSIARSIGQFVQHATGGEPVGRAWVDDVYGYRWHAANNTLVILSRPGRGGALSIPCSTGTKGSSIVYATDGARTSALVADDHVVITQSGGSVVAVLLSMDDYGDGAREILQGAEATVWRQQSAYASQCDDEDRLRLVYLGRSPQVLTSIGGDPSPNRALAEIVPRVNCEDRAVERKYQHWIGEIDVESLQQIAIVASAVRGGSAWHNDLLHQLIEVTVTVAGNVVPTDRWPTFPHAQAGGWSSTIDRLVLPPGRTQIDVEVTAVVPSSVDLVVELLTR